MTRSVAATFHSHAHESPNRTAVWVEGAAYSFKTLAQEASKVAAWIGTCPARSPTRIAILSGRSVTAYTGILAAIWAGASYVPLDIRLSESRLRTLLELSNPVALIVDDVGLRRARGVIASALPAHILRPYGAPAIIGGCAVQGRDALDTQEITEPPVEVLAENEAYLIFTSGTTGTPKGVRVSAGALACAIDSMQQTFQFTKDDRFGQQSDISVDFSVLDIFSAWHVGAPFYVVPFEKQVAPHDFIRSQTLTIWASVPTIIHTLNRMRLLKDNAFPSLRWSFFGGEPLAVQMARSWQAAASNSRIVNLYGQTEAPIASLYEIYDHDESRFAQWQTVPLGKPLVGVDAAVIDAKGNAERTNGPGELIVAGPHVSDGYLDNPDLTKSQFIEWPGPPHARKRWYKTGDKVTRDASGLFHFHGRFDRQFKISGHWVSPQEIEALLGRLLPRAQVAVIGWPIRNGQPQGLAAFIGGSTVDEDGVRDALSGEVPSYALPERIISVDAIPLTANGKVDRKRLAKFLSDREKVA